MMELLHARLRADDPVLLVDDEFLVLWMLEDTLGDIGLRNIHTAASTSSARALLASHTFAFGFLDINLGHEKSFALAETLMEKAIPFAFVSGYGRAGLEGRFGSVPVLSKPVDGKALRSVVSIES
ncbi:response regulator [Pelagibacterium montanilacus]|uniref:response regulator n=1 Tax=Pelagibacterium montanilacus TaxID=2185280 RepID=UPI000F8CAF2C|nr:response regulator [Pelagibacterium montanilacus]